MATNVTGRHYRTLYAMLLRLYPRLFRERFGEGMAQTFHDLCREHKGAGRGLFGLALWIFYETALGIVKENITRMSQPGKTMPRVALGALAALMVPLVASQMVEGWNWGARTFVFVYVLFFWTGMAYAVITRRRGAWSVVKGRRWCGAVGRVCLGVVKHGPRCGDGKSGKLGLLQRALGGAGWGRPGAAGAAGLARTLFAMAAILALISVLLPSGAPPHMPRNMAIGHAVYVALFAASGLLFRHAGLARVT